MRSSRLAPLALVGLLGASSLSACGGDDDPTVLNVLAAASLTDSFTELEERFEAENEDVDVRISFGSSATLALQAIEGAPGDVIATADTITMQDAVDGGAVDGEPQLFATNVATLVVPAENPGGIEAFDDIDSDDVSYVVCVPDAPCGNVAQTLLEANQITADPASEQDDVSATLQQVVEGQADAGIVYETDAISAGDAVTTVDIPSAEDEILDYPIAQLQQTEDAELAQQWIDLVLSSEGQEVLAGAGFGAP